MVVTVRMVDAGASGILIVAPGLRMNLRGRWGNTCGSTPAGSGGPEITTVM